MGTGLILHCTGCGEEQFIETGIGFFYPQYYEEVLGDIKKGVYGAEIRKVIEENKNAYVNAENCIYYCKACNHYEVQPCLDVFILDEKDGAGFAMPYEFEDKEPIYRYPHTCACGSPLERISTDALAGLAQKGKIKCPNCKTPVTAPEAVEWD